MSKVATRLLTFFIGLPIMLGLCFLSYMNHIVLAAIGVAACAIASCEMYNMLSNKVKLFNKVLLVIFSSLLPASIYIFNLFGIDVNIVTWILCFEVIILMGIECFTAKTFEESAIRISASTLLLFYCGFMTSFILRLLTIPPVTEGLFNHTTQFILLYFVLVFMCDSCAWFFGVLLGKSTRGIVAASPNKSLVGFIGGIVGTIFFGCIMKLIFSEALAGPWWKIILTSGLTAVAAIIGDLVESVLKRSCEVKDSGNIIPGRGGLLDCMDSLFLGAPVLYICIHILYL